MWNFKIWLKIGTRKVEIACFPCRSPRYAGSSVGILVTLGREFESRYLGFFPKCRTIKIVRTQNSKFDFTVDEGKERLHPSREKNKGMHRRRKVDEKSRVTFLLCNPGWYIQRT